MATRRRAESKCCWWMKPSAGDRGEADQEVPEGLAGKPSGASDDERLAVNPETGRIEQGPGRALAECGRTPLLGRQRAGDHP